MYRFFTPQEIGMFELIAVVVVIAVSMAIYKSGKREGSRKGFHAGRSQKRKSY
jgi:hypothetical protein